MTGKLVLIQSLPPMAKVVLGHLEYEIEYESLKQALNEYTLDRTNFENAANAHFESNFKLIHQRLCKEVERIAKLEDPRKELEELVRYLNTPIATA